MEQPNKPTVLIVDDEGNILRALGRLFRGEPFHVFATTDPDEALDLVEHTPVAVLVSDHRMPKLDGDHLIARVKALDPRVVCIRLTGYSDPEAPETELPREAVFRTIAKPWSDEEITAAVHEALGLYAHAATKPFENPIES